MSDWCDEMSYDEMREIYGPPKEDQPRYEFNPRHVVDLARDHVMASNQLNAIHAAFKRALRKDSKTRWRVRIIAEVAEADEDLRWCQEPECDICHPRKR